MLIRRLSILQFYGETTSSKLKCVRPKALKKYTEKKTMLLGILLCLHYFSYRHRLSKLKCFFFLFLIMPLAIYQILKMVHSAHNIIRIFQLIIIVSPFNSMSLY